jgi:hypothetical protein
LKLDFTIYRRQPCLCLAGALNFLGFRRMITMQTSLSARIAVTAPAGGEMSGLMAHFLFAENSPVFMGLFLGFWHKTGQTP